MHVGCALIPSCYVATHYGGWLYRGGRLVNNGLFPRLRFECDRLAWSLAHGAKGVRESLAGFIAMKGTLDLKVTRVLEAGGLALVAGVWSFTGTGPDGKP